MAQGNGQSELLRQLRGLIKELEKFAAQVGRIRSEHRKLAKDIARLEDDIRNGRIRDKEVLQRLSMLALQIRVLERRYIEEEAERRRREQGEQ